MAAEAARIARLEKVVRDLDPQIVLAHVDKDIAEQVVKETSDEGKRRRIILSLIKRQKQPSSSLDKILSVLEGNLVISRLQDHCASIPTPKVIEHLMKESLATTDEKEEIEYFKTAAGRGGKLLDYLERLLEGNETGRVMKVLYAALVKCKAFHLAKLVFPEEPLDVDDPRKLEPMTEDHKGLLNRKRIDLNGIDVKKVIPHLQAMEQLDGYDADTITTERTSVGQTSKLIDTLRTKSDFAFHAFMCALYENGYQHLVTLLDSTFRIVKEDQSQFTRATNAAKDARTDGRVRPEGLHTEYLPTHSPRPLQTVSPMPQQTLEMPTNHLPFSQQATSHGPVCLTQNPPSSQVNDYIQNQETKQAELNATYQQPAAAIEQARQPHLFPVLERAQLVGATYAPTVAPGAHGLSYGDRRGDCINPRSELQPMVTDLTHFLDSVLRGDKWTYTVLWFVATPEDSFAVMAILKKHCHVVCEEVSLDLIQTVQVDLKVIFIDSETVRKLIILVTQKKPGQDQVASVCTQIMEKCKSAHMAVMSGRCSGSRQHTELGDIILAESSYTTEFRAMAKRDRREVSLEMADCPAKHLSVLTTRMNGRELLWQKKDVCECGRPSKTKEYQYLFFSRVLIELKHSQQSNRWLQKFGFKVNELLLNDDNIEALEKECPAWSEIAKDAEKHEKWVEDEDPDAPYGLKPNDSQETAIKRFIRRDHNYPAKPKNFTDLKRQPMFTSSTEHHNAEEVFEAARKHKHTCNAVDSESYKFYEMARDQLEGKPAFVAKGVSNFADGELEDEAFEEYARQISAVFLLDAIRMFAEAEKMSDQQRKKGDEQSMRRQMFTDL